LLGRRPGVAEQFDAIYGADAFIHVADYWAAARERVEVAIKLLALLCEDDGDAGEGLLDVARDFLLHPVRQVIHHLERRLRQRSNRPDPMQVAGFEITTIVPTEQTGNYEVFHQAGPAGKGPGPHFHDWDESFLVVSGTVECGVDGMDSVAGPGTFIHVPGGSTHWFRFGPDGGEMITMTSQGNASAMFAAFHTAGSWDNPDRSVFVELAASYGQTVAPNDNPLD
jgi:quercetin dioxygenase-like cupin family protein